MSLYNIPEEDTVAFKKLLALPDSAIESIRSAMIKLPVGSLPKDIPNELSKKIKIPIKDLAKIINVLFAVHAIKNKESQETKAVVEDIVNSIQELHPSFKLTKNEWNLLRNKLASILDIDSSAGLTLKTLNLGGEFMNVYVSSRILTDIRASFSADMSKIEAALVVHTLKIEYHVNDEHQEFFITLPTSSIKSLKEQLVKAEKKEELLNREVGKKLNFLPNTNVND